jgi:hypothetical protein
MATSGSGAGREQRKGHGLGDLCDDRVPSGGNRRP